jgi:hypothetical protein
MFLFQVEARGDKTYDASEVEKTCVKSVYCVTGYII